MLVSSWLPLARFTRGVARRARGDVWSADDVAEGLIPRLKRHGSPTLPRPILGVQRRLGVVSSGLIPPL